MFKRRPGRQLVRWLSQTVKTTDYKLNANDVPNKSVIFSMVQPTGKFHLGNYLGSVRVWKDLCDLKQPETKLLFGAADLHAITVPIPDGARLREQRVEAVASILSVGVDPLKAELFYQSQVHQHAELHWILSTLAPMGLLNRMTQWKSKSNLNNVNDEESLGKVKLGLFSYPVLQAADILLYRSTHVPVGEDQAQHLELTRTLAQTFNKTFGKNVFPLPSTLLAPTKRILSLANPSSKMSKSDKNQNATIYLNDDADTIIKKIRKAVTDSISDKFYYDPAERPGVSNLINVVSGVRRLPVSEIESDIANIRSHSDFKNYVSEVLVEELKEPRERFNLYMSDPAHLENITKKGAHNASELAEANLKTIKNLMGF